MDRAEAAAILGVSPTASADEVQRAHRSKSRLLHPDRFAGSPADQAAATAEQARVNVARDVLLTPPPAAAAPPGNRAAAPHLAAARRLEERAARLYKLAGWVGIPSLVIFVLSLVTHTALPPIVRPVVIISVVGSFALTGMARTRQRRAEDQLAAARRLGG